MTLPQPGLRCAMCQFPEDVAKMRSDAACCTGCCDECVCLDRVWYGKRRGRDRGPGTRKRHVE